MKKFAYWFFAVVITLVLSIYQRMTGPTYPKKLTVELRGVSYQMKLPRSGVQQDVLVKLPTERKYMPLLVILSFISAGAAGNFIDRVMRRSVVDFIYFVPIDFPVFNVADIFVTCSTALLVILVLFYYQESDFNFLKDGARKKKP